MTREPCDCAFDMVPLRGPADDCDDCKGTGTIPPLTVMCPGCAKVVHVKWHYGATCRECGAAVVVPPD